MIEFDESLLGGSIQEKACFSSVLQSFPAPPIHELLMTVLFALCGQKQSQPKRDNGSFEHMFVSLLVSVPLLST